MKPIILTLALTISFACPGMSAGIRVDSRTTVFIDRSEPGALQKAAADLAADCQRVFGQPCALVHEPSPAGTSTLWIAFRGRLPRGVKRPEGWEQLRIQAVPGAGTGSAGHDAVVLTGSDLRGAIYAVYEFSQRFLGVDPLYWWTDHAPARRSQVEVPAGFSLTEGPTFRYRGWFVNDEDLLTGWKPGLADGTGISLDVWDHLFEALLRLKGNVVIPGTWIFPYEPQIRAAGERGLAVAQHHVNVLGLDTYRWPQDKPYSYSSHPDLFAAAWARAAGQYPPGAEVLWSVGYRGQGDHPFWREDKDAAATDEGRAQTIQSAIAKQLEIIRRLDPAAPVFLTAYGENTTFIQKGLLHVPEGVTMVWVDNGHGRLGDQTPLRPGQGEYYHLATMNRLSDHYSEMVPLPRIQRELGRAVKAGATGFLIVNTANLRPVVMTARAVMELSWNAQPWLDSNADESRSYLLRWCREEFGAAAAPDAARYYAAYFAAPGRFGTNEDDVMGDNFYHTAARQILLTLLENHAGSPVPVGSRLMFDNLDQCAAFLAKACHDADERWQQARLLAARTNPLVASDRRDFFQAHILTQVDLHGHFNLMVERLAEMVQATDPTAKKAKLQSAIQECQAALQAMRKAEYGKWQGFYTQGDWLLDTPRTLLLAQAYLDKLEGRAVPENAIIRAEDAGFAYHMITAYQGTQAVQF